MGSLVLSVLLRAITLIVTDARKALLQTGSDKFFVEMSYSIDPYTIAMLLCQISAGDFECTRRVMLYFQSLMAI